MIGIAIFQILTLLILAFLIYTMFRNNTVSQFRLKVIEEVFDRKSLHTELEKIRSEPQDDPMAEMKAWDKFRDQVDEKRKEMDTVSYDKMLLMFWRPLKSFYPTLGKKIK